MRAMQSRVIVALDVSEERAVNIASILGIKFTPSRSDILSSSVRVSAF